MSSSHCGSARDANTSDRHWDCANGFNCEFTVKTNVPTRRKREFTPDELKDGNYWVKRSRNNEAAKRSRERRRIEERLLEERALRLLRENEELKAALSAIHYYGLGKETSCDAFMDCSPSREQSQESYLRSHANRLGVNHIPHCALSSRCDLSSAYESGPFPRTQCFSAASYIAVDNAHQRDGYTGICAPSQGHAPSSACNNIPYAINQTKWGQGHARSTMNSYLTSAPFSINELMPGYQCAAGTLTRWPTHARMNETYVEQRALVTEPKNHCKEMEIVEETKRIPTSPLLPHKLRYKVNKTRSGGERAHATPGISPYIQE